MNIGILTYQFGTNFGGQLQCHALFNVLTSMGHNVTIINYIPNKTRNAVYKDIKKALKELKKGCNYDRINTAYHILMSSRKMRTAFRNYQTAFLKIGLECTSPQEIVSKYPSLDAIIVGSDQVWAPAHHKSGVYFLNFTPPFRGKKIAYAPCCAINRVDQLYRQQTVKCLKNFDNLSARNIETQNFIKDLIGINAPIVADPTFLWDFKELLHSKKYAEKYILVYILGSEIQGGHLQAIHKIKQTHGNLPVFTISLTASKPHYFSWADKTFWTCSPIEWINLIRNASFLYTDSFHGVVFALKFHIPFLAYYTETIRASRFIDLKTRFKLNNIITNTDQISKSSVDFAFTDEKIKELKETSLQYLTLSLNK